MKMKVKFNTAAIKNFLLEHGEKIALGGAVLVFVWLGYAALRRETLPVDKGPDRLAAAAQAAQTHVANSTFNPQALQLPSTDYEDKTKRPIIEVAHYSGGVMNDPIGEPMQKRSDPQILALEGLRAAAGAGTFALMGKDAVPPKLVNQAKARPPQRAAAPRDPDGELGILNPDGAAKPEAARMLNANVVIPGVRPPAGSKLKPTYWAVVTAVVPYRKQAGEFDKVFATALGGDSARDFPQYKGYKIQRAEDNGSDPDKLAWTDINLKDYPKLIKTWAMEALEVVDPNYLDPKFAMPLGPLVGAWWTPDVGHHPEIAFVQGKMEGVEDGAAEEEMGEEAPAAEEVDEDGFVDMADDGNAAPAPGVRPRQNRLAAVEDEDGPVARPAPQARRPAPVAAREKKVGRENDLLFRFFDFTVEPGKTYRYRVQLGLENPNFGVAVKFLKGGDAPKKKTLITAWSQATPAVTVPFSDGVLAGRVQRNSATIAVYKIDEESGLEVLTTEEFPRGGAVNFTKDVPEVVDPLNNNVRKQDNVKFVTNSVVVDMHGGKVLDPKDKEKTTEAGEVLLIDRDGNLVVHDEMDDLPTFKAKDPKELLEGTSPQSKGAPDWGGILGEPKQPKASVKTKTPRAGRTREPRATKAAAPKPKPPAKTKKAPISNED